MSRKLFFNILKFTFFLAFGIVLIWLINRGLDPEDKKQIGQSFLHANYSWVVLSIVLGLSSHIIRALRWRMMIEPLGRAPRVITAFYAVMIGYLVNMAVPRLGEITRCGVIRRYEHIPFDKSIGTIIVERAIDLLLLFIFTLILFISQFGLIYSFFRDKVIRPIGGFFENPVELMIGITTAALIIFLVWRIVSRWEHSHKFLVFLRNIRAGMYSVRHMKNFPLFILYTLLMWGCYLSMVWVCFYAIPQTASFGVGQALAVLVFGTVGIISTPGGLGAYHIIVTETLSALYGLDKPYAVSYSWIAWSCQTVMIIFIGVTSLLLLSRHSRHKPEYEKA